jgi:hypothetical protein
MTPRIFATEVLEDETEEWLNYILILMMASLNGREAICYVSSHSLSPFFIFIIFVLVSVLVE